MLNIQLDYGNPFESRTRKPYDFFKLRLDADFGVGRKYLDNMIGYGILFGKNMQLGKMSLLVGGFQYNDYWDSKLFELGALGLGGGVISILPIRKTVNLNTKIHLAIVPFAGSSTRFGPDTSQFRDYDYGTGWEAKFESVLNLGKYADISLVYYYYMIFTFNGLPGTNNLHIFKPRITLHLYKNLNIGFEEFIYYNDRNSRHYPDIHATRTEQKLFLLFYFENSQRRGHYK